MSIFIFIYSFILLSTYSISIIERKQINRRIYVIVRDYFLAFKAPEFSVYNTSEKDLYYRIESNYDIQHNIKLVNYPSKQTLAKLRSKTQGKKYEAKISIRNITSNKWLDGIIIQNDQWFYTNYSIQWNQFNISIINKISSLTTTFQDQSQGHLLAQFHRIWFSRKFKYQLEVFSDKVPESIFFLGFAVISRGKNG